MYRHLSTASRLTRRRFSVRALFKRSILPCEQTLRHGLLFNFDMEIEPAIPLNIILSDSVIREEGTRKFSFIGTFDQFNVASFPFQPVPFFVTVCLSNFRGKLNGYKIALRLEEKSSGYVVASAGGEIGSTSELRPTDTIQVPFQLTGIFHSHGVYSIVVLADSEPLGSRDFLVNPPPKAQAS
jgi:hypothetical protein